MRPANPILQFGTSRFLQAHVDFFVSQAMDHGQALGGITVVQTTSSATSSVRTQAFTRPKGFPVVVRGLVDGQPVEQHHDCHAIRKAFNANNDWPLVRAEMCAGVQVVVSNTGDSGWALFPEDGPHLLAADAPAPRSFPAKLLVLLHGRWTQCPSAPLTVLPCELVSRNGSRLHELVEALAREWKCPPAFLAWLGAAVVWGNSLVDRIVSEAIVPVGAVAEPYALWAIERQPGLCLPCQHPAIVLTNDLDRVERLKLHLLNLGHTVLADLWLDGGHDPDMTVLQAMNHPVMRSALEAVWQQEVLPVFDAMGEGGEAASYLATLRDRLLNPYLVHRLADIAQNHAAKKERRIAPVVELAQRHAPALAQPRLRALLQLETA